MLAKEKSNGYIVYRYGKDNKIELEFPEKNAQSWKRFTFNYYFRGGGKPNAGLDINNVKFENNGFKYTIYSSYSAGDAKNEESYTVGILIYDKDEKLTRIEGVPATEVGSLGVFRTNELLTIDLESGLED